MDRRNWNWEKCNWNWKNVDDVSPFLLFESTGDSEANSDLNVTSLTSYDNMEVVTYEVDDAQSCSSNLSGSFYDYTHQDQENMQCSHKKSKKKHQLCPFAKCKKKQQEHALSSKKKEHEYVKYGGYNPNYRDYNDDDDDDDDGVIDQWPCEKKGFVGSKQKHNKNKSKVSKVEPVKDEEKDKLFWDTCLGT